MKWSHRKSNRDCASQPLVELIRDELDEIQCERLATHLNDCETCQQRLTVLAADSQWWLDASRWLDPAAGGVDPCNEELECDFYGDSDSLHSNPERDLLASELLAPSDKAGVIGTLGRYEVQSVLGAGGTGIVLKAIDVELNRTVAIKVLSPTLAASGAARRRFAREGQAVAAVAHENVIAVHQVEGGGRLPFLVMQYVDGDSLQDLVVRDGPLDVKTALRITAQIASALSAAHDQGLVHRDVKPANILVGAAGQRVWITDFGLARAVDDASLTRTGFIAGTPHYMSPEQARGETVRASSDLFGLGSVLYFMLTGRPPFRAERTLAILSRICNEPHRPVREVNPDVPPAIADLVDRLLSKSAEDRIAGANVVRTHCLGLLAALAEPNGDLNRMHAGDSPSVSRDVTAEPHGWRHLARYGAWTVLFLILIGLSVTAGAYVRKAGQTLAVPTDSAKSIAEAVPAPLAATNDDRSGKLLESVVTTEESGRSAIQDGPSFPVVAATAEMDPSPSWRPAGQLSSPQHPASQTPEDRPPVSLGSDSKPPRWDGPIASEPAQLEPPASTAGRDVVVANEGSSTWQIGFNELRASVELFETQIEKTPGDTLRHSPLSPQAPDAFMEELRRMENSLRMLESPLLPRYQEVPWSPSGDNQWEIAPQLKNEPVPVTVY